MDDLRTLIDETYELGSPATRGLTPITLPDVSDPSVSVIYAFLGETPNAVACFGQIMAIIAYEADSGKPRYFRVRFHVWAPHQHAGMANRLVEVEELITSSFTANKETICYLSTEATDFGKKAVWLATPDSETGDDGRALRALARSMKKYSVDNKICYRFRSKWKNMS